MPRPKQIIVDDNAILAAIRRAWQSDVEAAKSALATMEAKPHADRRSEAWGDWCDLTRYLRQVEYDGGIRNDLARWWGRLPTPSERIRLQECVRRLEAAGKVIRTTIYIRPAEPVAYSQSPTTQAAETEQPGLPAEGPVDA